MVIKFYVSSISGNKEIKKRQMKAQLIMESKGVDFQVIDISDPGQESERRFMQTNAKSRNNARHAIPPQFFNEEDYCGDYEGFDEANETDTLEEFLKLPKGALPQVPIKHHDISGFSSRDVSMEKETFSSLPAHLSQPKSNGTETLEPHSEAKTETVEENDVDEEEVEESGENKAIEEEDGEARNAALNKSSVAEDHLAHSMTDGTMNDENENQQSSMGKQLKSENNDEEEEEEEDDEEEDEEEEEEETLDDILKGDDGEAEP